MSASQLALPINHPWPGLVHPPVLVLAVELARPHHQRRFHAPVLADQFRVEKATGIAHQPRPFGTPAPFRGVPRPTVLAFSGRFGHVESRPPAGAVGIVVGVVGALVGRNTAKLKRHQRQLQHRQQRHAVVDFIDGEQLVKVVHRLGKGDVVVAVALKQPLEDVVELAEEHVAKLLRFQHHVAETVDQVRSLRRRVVGRTGRRQ